MEGGVAVKVVGTTELFNLPLYEHHLVIDTRSSSDYHSGHVATAVSFPGPPEGTSESDKEKKLVKFIKAYVKEYLRPENPNPIVIYGDSEQPQSQVHSEWLISKLQVLHSGRHSLCPLAPDSDSSDDGRIDQEDSSRQTNYFEQFCNLLADYTSEIWLLGGSYADFQHQYSFLCGHVEFSSMFPLPHQINDYLFLGSRVVPLDGPSLRLMGITHLIVSDQQSLKLEEIQGMEVLQCSVRESNSQDMSVCWEASCAFIDNATSKGDVRVRVLVLLFGRSRSTSIVLAYLIRKFGMSFEKSLKYVKSNCWHLIDQSLIFEQQLRAWQERQAKPLTN